MSHQKQKLLLLTGLLLFGIACRTMAPYHAASFEKTATLKAKTLVLMEHASEDYSAYTKKADDILVQAETLYAMQKVRDKNAVSIAQWQKLMQPDPLTGQSYLPGFFALWKQKKTLSQTFIKEAKQQVAAAFDEILRLEGAKLKN